MIRFGPQVCGNLDEASKREWLVADGLGGYAMGTVAGLRTRRYHGLLIVAVDGPGRRMLGLAAIDPVLVLGDARIRLATDEWGNGTVDPRGHELLASFDLTDGVPRWRWQVGGTILDREVAAVHGSSTFGIVHRLVAQDRPVLLELTPLCTWRDAHGERRANGAPEVASEESGFVFEQAYRVEGAGWQPTGAWYRDVRAREETARGLPDREDLWAAGTFRVELETGGCHEVTAAALPAPKRLPRAAKVVAAARDRAHSLVRASGAADEVDAQLVLAADQFTITPAGRPTAVAGYPWFGEWSRDLMTSYEGLYLATRRHDEGREVLLAAAATVSEGMLANTADTGSLEYNTADGTLWLFQAVHALERAGGGAGFLEEIYPAIRKILAWHARGTHHGIRVDPADGLLVAGDAGTQLTWMDAKVGDWVVTPRHGKPVEVNALWYNALRLGARWAGALGRREEESAWSRQADRAARSFAASFWDAERRQLVDVIRPDGVDRRLRPNQLLAVSLPFPLLDQDQRRAIVAAVEHALLTPYGLRTLAPGEPEYRPSYRGGPLERDGAYHQGAIWPWLLGPFVRARLAAYGRTPENLARCRALVEGMAAHLEDAALGHVSEILEPEPPFRPVGAPAQAWSVATLLEVLLQDLAVDER